MHTLKCNNPNCQNLVIQQDSQIQLNKVETSLNVFQELQKENAILTKQMNEEIKQYNKILLSNPNDDVPESAQLNVYSKRRRELSTLSSFILQQLLSELNDYFKSRTTATEGSYQ